MVRFIDCQIAITPWGTKACFKRAKVGLMRKGNNVFIAVFYRPPNKNEKLPVDQKNIELLPAAIRFKCLQKDLFIRQPGDEQRYTNMMREIRVLLNKEKLRQTGKAELLERLISSIPLYDAYNPRDLVPPAKIRSVRLVADLTCQIKPNSLDGGSHIVMDDHYQTLIDSQPKLDMSVCKKKLENSYLDRIEIIGLERIPKQLWSRNSLQQLTLSNCNLKNFPKQIESFSDSLVYLNLSHNSIETLPRTFCCKMNRLVTLDLGDNLIETLPLEIKFLRRLVVLNVSQNRLRMLPSTFSDLKRLQKLDVAKNKLSQLPAFRKEDVRLLELDVSYNPLDGASSEINTFEVHPSYDRAIGYYENRLSQNMSSMSKNNKPSSLFETSLLKIVRCDILFKLASEVSLPETIVSTMQREIFKCFNCSQLHMLPAYNSTDILDYVEQVRHLTTSKNYTHGMTFMKLLCRLCFDKMSS